MPHYKLTSPADENATLKRRGASWDCAIYECEATGNFYMLHMDREGNRFLYSYRIEGPKPVIDKSQKFEVPDDWTGDPQTYYVSHDLLPETQLAPEMTVVLTDQLRKWLEDGDRVLVTSDEDAVIGEIVDLGGTPRFKSR